MLARLAPLFVLAAVTTACDEPPGEGEGEEGEGEEDAGEGEGEEGEGEVDAVPLVGATKGGAIAVDEAGSTVAAANAATGDVTFFDIADPLAPVERARVVVGGEPVSVSFANNGVVYVVDKAGGVVVEVKGATGADPVKGRSVAVGDEPVQAALAPSGTRLYVTSSVTGNVAVVDTATLTVTSTIHTGGNPWGVCISNDGDADDDDEGVFVTDFYARAIVIPGLKEATDGSRFGRVFKINPADESVSALQLLPVVSSGVPNFEATGMFPNQLSSCAVNLGRVYVANVGASPAGFDNGTDFHQNVQGLVSVLDALTGEEVPSDSLNVNAAVAGQAGDKRFGSVLVDVAFVAGTDIGYVVSLAADAAYRIDFAPDVPVVGAAGVSNFLPTGKSPTGIAVRGTTAWTYNEVSRSISVIDLGAQQTVVVDLPSAPQPTDATEIAALNGQRFFNTGNARWSDKAWVSCAACHPRGTTDNVTWSFPAGPRQTLDLTATFNADGSKQRILNWTAIFDEIHDFELNTRNVAGGTGAIVSSPNLNADGTANVGVRLDLTGNDGNLGSAAAVAATSATPDDWNQIEQFLKSLRTPRGDHSDEAAIARGRAQFDEGRCKNCHGGALWTLSERYYLPVLDSNFTTLTLASQGVATVGQVLAPQLPTTDTTQLFVLQNDVAGGPARHTCVSRKVGTFDVDGPDDRGAVEVRVNGAAAQGADGYNVPSLLGMARGAPFLHHGGAESLEALLDPTGDYAVHLRSGNLNFSPNVDQLSDLAAFLRSLDDDAVSEDVPVGQQICPAALSP